MRKLLSLVAVFLLASTAWMVANAEWYKGDRKTADQIKANDTIILAAASNDAARGHYLDGLQIVESFTQTTPFVVVSAADGKFYLKQVSTGKFLGYTSTLSAEDNEGEMVTNQDKAFAFSIIDGSGEDLANTTSPLDKTEQVLFRATYKDSANADVNLYLANWWGQLGDVPIWTYTDTAPWEVLTATQVFSAKRELTDLVNTYSSESTDNILTDGTEPGYFGATAVNAYKAALTEAQTFLTTDHSEAECQAMLTKLKEARTAFDNSMIPVSDGYYFIVSGYDQYFAQQQVYKGMYTDGGLVKWKDLDKTSPNFVFKITKIGDGEYSIQNFGDGSYINTVDGTSSNVPTSKTQTTAQTIKYIGSASFNIANTGNKMAYHTGGHGGGAGKKGNIVTWNGGVNTASAWKFTKVSQALVDSLTGVKAQNLLNNNLSSLIDKGQALYDANFIYSADMTKPMITNINKNDDSGQVSSNAKETSEGSYSNLIDKTDDGKPNYQTYFHSQWSGTGPNEDHYLQVDVTNFQAENSAKQFIFTWSRRRSNNNNRPTKMTIYATNDTTGGGTWKTIKTIASDWPTAANDTNYTSKGVVMDQAYKYIRFTVNATNNGAMNNGHVFFTCSDFQMYPVTLDQERSQYVATPGMKDAADALLALIQADKEKPANNTATQDDIDKLQAAIDAVKALYADTTEYVKLRNKAQNYVDSVVVGEGFGELSDQTLATNLQTLINEQKTTVDLNIPKKDQLAAAVTALQGKVDEFLAGIKTIKPNTWYYIINAGKSATYAYGKAIICNSKSLGGGSNFGGVVDGAPMYTENPYAMWRFVPIEGSKYYGVQNLGTGHFLGKYRGYGNAGKPLTVNKPEPYAVEYLGKGQMTIVSKDSTNTYNYQLHAQNDGSALVNWPASINNASAWTFKEVQSEENEVGQFSLDFANHSLQIVAFPFDIDGDANALSALNEGVKAYAVKSITNDGTNTTIDLTELTEAIPAGTPFVLEVEQADGDSLVSIATLPKWEVSTESKNANGIIGTLDGLTLNKAGFGYIAGNALNITTDSQVTIGGGSGYFTPEGVVEGTGETSKQLSSAGLLDAIKMININKGTVRVNVYTIDGKLVKSNVLTEDAKQGLNKGIYIIGKKKVAVK